MTTRKKAAPTPPLRKGASDEDIIQWTQTHDVFDRLEAGISEVVKDRRDLEQLLQDALLEGNTAQLNMRIPPAMKAALSRLARQERRAKPRLYGARLGALGEDCGQARPRREIASGSESPRTARPGGHAA